MGSQDQGRQAHGYFGPWSFGSSTIAMTKISQLRGGASYYNLPDNQMANGQTFDANAMNAAMLKVPLDRGRYIPGQVIDLTPRAFNQLFGDTRRGTGQVVVVIPGRTVAR